MNIDDIRRSIPHFALAAAVSGTAPRVFFRTSLTSSEILDLDSDLESIDLCLRESGLRRDLDKGGFAPGGIAGIKAAGDSNLPRVEGEGCIFCLPA